MQPSDEIKQRIDIVDFIREYINLKAVGVNFSARCPFHNEKSPSFVVSPDKQIWHCFGCGKGGDVFSFIQEMDGLDFVEALRVLAPRAGVTLKRQNPEESSKRNRVLDIIELSAKYFHHLATNTDYGKVALKYLRERGLSEETIEDWRLGYSLDSWDNLYGVLKKKGFSDDEIFASGMSIKKEQGSSFYDRFRGRIMFPISDSNGNVVAFTARVDPSKQSIEKMGKYINSPQTIVYDKSKIIFGLDKAKTQIKANDLAIIVEGQMDVITAHQNGFKNVIASSGTALTIDQLKLIKRYSKNIALAFDMDSAGEMAAERGIREAMKEEMNIKVVELPSGKDPDECIKKNPDEFEIAIKSSKHLMQYYFDKTFSRLDKNDIDGKRKATQILLPIIGRIKNKIEQDFWIKSFGEMINISEDVVRETIAINSKNIKKYSDTKQTDKNYNRQEKSTRGEELSRSLLAIVLRKPEFLDYLLNALSIDLVIGQDCKTLYKNLSLFYNSNNNIVVDASGESSFSYLDIKSFLDKNLSDKHQLDFVDELGILGENDFFDFSEEQLKNELNQLIRSLKAIYLQTRMKEIEKAILELEKNNSEDSEINILLQELNVLTKEINDLNKF